MSFWRRISPKSAVEDFASEWQRPTPHRWQILGVSVAATFAILMVFLPDSEKAPPAKPDITYISTLAPDRTREEIIASNRANQERKDKLAAIAAERAERRKQMYRELGRATFVDVDAMEAEIARDEAAAAKRGAAGQAQPAPGEQ